MTENEQGLLSGPRFDFDLIWDVATLSEYKTTIVIFEFAEDRIPLQTYMAMQDIILPTWNPFSNDCD